MADPVAIVDTAKKDTFTACNEKVSAQNESLRAILERATTVSAQLRGILRGEGESSESDKTPDAYKPRGFIMGTLIDNDILIKQIGEILDTLNLSI